MCREILGTRQMADQVEEVEEVSIESVAPNLSDNPAVLDVKSDKLRSIKKPTSLLAEALFLMFADGRKETSAMDRNWL